MNKIGFLKSRGNQKVRFFGMKIITKYTYLLESVQKFRYEGITKIHTYITLGVKQ